MPPKPKPKAKRQAKAKPRPKKGHAQHAAGPESSESKTGSAKNAGNAGAKGIASRVVETRRMRYGDLIANPKNWRRHTKKQTAILNAVMQDVGDVGAVIAYQGERGLTLLDGHGRQKLDPDHEGIVLITDLDETEAAIVLASFDSIGALAETDRDALHALIKEVDAEGAIKSALEALDPFPKAKPREAQDSVTELASMITNETEYRASAQGLAESIIASVTAKIMGLAQSDPAALDKAIMVVLPKHGGRALFVIADGSTADIVAELRRRAEAGEQSPLDALFANIWEPKQ